MDGSLQLTKAQRALRPACNPVLGPNHDPNPDHTPLTLRSNRREQHVCVQARAAAEERAAQQAALEAREMEEIQALQRQQSALAVEAARLAAAAQQVRPQHGLMTMREGFKIVR